jgi:membrane protease YdiL (CAAX protease family)
VNDSHRYRRRDTPHRGHRVRELTAGSDPGDARAVTEAGSRAPGNPFGVWEAAFGLVVGFLLSIVADSAYSALAGGHPGSIGTDIADFVGLWTGFVGAAVIASRMRGSGWQPGVPALETPTAGASAGQAAGAGPRAVTNARRRFAADFGVSIRLWPDVPLGVVVGVASQYVLVPVLELPLEPFVHNLSSKLGQPANNLLTPVSGTSLVVLTILVCVGSPLVEELFFRGLLLRGLLGRFDHLGRRLGPALSMAITGIVFGLVHFESLQFLGLAGFGMVLSYLAYRTGRLGASILAHVAFNTTTIIAFVLQH